MEDEKWLPIPAYAAWYEACTSGQIASLARSGTAGGLLTPQLNSRGYWVVILCRYGVCRMHPVARLVLVTFAGPANGRRVRFGPGGPQDCSLANLEWR